VESISGHCRNSEEHLLEARGWSDAVYWRSVPVYINMQWKWETDCSRRVKKQEGKPHCNTSKTNVVERGITILEVRAALKRRRIQLQITKNHYLWQSVTSLRLSGTCPLKCGAEQRGRLRFNITPPPFVLTSAANLIGLRKNMKCRRREFFFRNTATGDGIITESIGGLQSHTNFLTKSSITLYTC
jgi:hypothetical protein